MGHFAHTSAAFLVVVLVSGCGSTETRHTVKKVTPETAEGVPEAPTSARDGASGEKRTVQKALAERLEKAEADITEIAAKTAALPEKARATWDATLEQLKADAAALKRDLEELEATAGDAWRSVRDRAARSWEAFEEAVKQAASEARLAEGSESGTTAETGMPVDP
jgi:hypothetical protein